MSIRDFIERQGQKLFSGHYDISSTSVPAGGCAASGAVAEPVVADVEEDRTGPYLKRIHAFEGYGLYIYDASTEYVPFIIYPANAKDYNFLSGKWWKICE